MEIKNFSSKLLDSAVDEFANLPGVGRKTALRYVLYLLKKDHEDLTRFGDILKRLKEEIIHCKICHNISDTEICPICSNNSRDRSVICVVENIRDVMSVEATQQYQGLYHVLGGIISPMEGVSPSDLNMVSLEKRLEEGGVKELILALSTTMEGETTNFYIHKKLHHHGVQISTLARGVAFGDDLEYTDELTLGRSILHRTPFEPGSNK